MRRSWVRGAISGTMQGVTLLALRAAVICYALLLCSRGQATAGDIALVLTSYFVLQGYLRDVGMHVRNVQRSVNDMEELVYIQSQPLDIADCPEAKQIRIMKIASILRKSISTMEMMDCRSSGTSQCR